MSEYSVYFNPPGFDDYPRTVQDTVDHVALNAHVERTDVADIYVTGITIPSAEDNDKIWIHTPQPGDVPEPPLPVPPPPSGTSATRILVVAETYSSATMLRAYNPTTGAVDNTFSVSWITIPNPAIRGLALGPSGKYYIVVRDASSPAFTIYRINSDGSQDGTFTPGVFGGTSLSVSGLQVQPNGKIIAFGIFSTYNATAAVSIVRINTNGTRDSTFDSTTGVAESASNGAIQTAGIQADGSILIGGVFNRYKGANLSPTRINFCRLTSTASLDTSFTPYVALSPFDFFVQGDQKILVSSGATGVVRKFLSNGAQDTSFSIFTAGAPVFSIVQASNEKIYIGGQFSSLGEKVARLNPNGSIDSTFVSSLPSDGSVVRSLAVSNSGACFVSGVIFPFPYRAYRLTSSGAIDGAFTAPPADASSQRGLLLQESPEITSSDYSSGFINAAFSYQIVALPAPVISYSATGLPTGLSLNSSTGLISGTPTVSGIFPVLLGATNASGTSTKGMNIQIFDAVPTTDFATPALRRYSSGAWLEFSTLNRGDIIITSNDEDVTFPWGESGKVYDLSPWGEANFTVPTLPTPPVGFIYKYYIGAQILQPIPAPITPVPNAPSPVINSPSTTTQEMNTAFSYQITASSTVPILLYGASGLPTGLSVNTGTGLISGTPTSVSNNATVETTATISAASGVGIDFENLVITLQQRPVITSSLTPLVFTAGTAITPYTITATKSPTSFGASSLPTGLSIDTATGIISGTPQVGSSGNYSTIISATNAVLTGSATLPITVNEVPVITSPSTATATYLQNFSYQITASGTPSPTSYGATSLPAPLSLNSSTGAITGQISGPPYGSISAGVSATNAIGTGSLPVTLNIVGLAADIVTQPRGVHKIGSTYFLLLLNYSGATPTAPWYVYTSTDRVTWTKSLLTSSPGFQLVNDVKTVYDGAEWVFMTSNPFVAGTPGVIFSTSNGTSWTRLVATGNFGSVATFSLTYFNGKYLMFGLGNSAGSTMYSSNKTTWTNAGGGAGSTSDDHLIKCDTISGVALRTGRRTVTTAKSAAVSTNGISWSYYNVPFVSNPSFSEPYVAAGNAVFIGMPELATVTATYYRSTDGLNWTSYTVPTGNSSGNIRIVFRAGKFWWNIGGGGFGAYSSTDGLTWASDTFLSNDPALPQYYFGTVLSEVDTSNSGEVASIAYSDVNGSFGFPFNTVISNTARNSWTSSNSITI